VRSARPESSFGRPRMVLARLRRLPTLIRGEQPGWAPTTNEAAGAMVHDGILDVLRLADPRRPASGKGRPRSRAERSSPASGCPATSHDQAAASLEGLTPPEWAALRRFADSGHAVVEHWPVGRAVSRALVRRGLVLITSEWVLLTEAGWRALQAASVLQPASPRREAPPRPQTGPTRPTTNPSRTTRQPSATPPARPPEVPSRVRPGPLIPPGVLLYASRTSRKQTMVREGAAMDHRQPAGSQEGEQRRDVPAVL